MTTEPKEPELSPLIDLQTTRIPRECFKSECEGCPANDGVFFDLDTKRHSLYCAVQAALLTGEPRKASILSLQLNAGANPPKCQPLESATKIKQYLDYLAPDDMAI